MNIGLLIKMKEEKISGIYNRKQKILNSFEKMANDVINERAKCGSYEYGNTLIIVKSNEIKSVGQRVKEYYERNPDKMQLVLAQKRALYQKRKNQGLCVKCSEKATSNKYGNSIVFCKRHQKDNNKYQINARKNSKRAK